MTPNDKPRVYLMADFGKGPRVYFRGASHPMNETRNRAYMPTNTVQAILSDSSDARCWWLIEADSADQARRVIAASANGSPPDCDCGSPDQRPTDPPDTAHLEGCAYYGRILDQGGPS